MMVCHQILRLWFRALGICLISALGACATASNSTFADADAGNTGNDASIPDGNDFTPDLDGGQESDAGEVDAPVSSAAALLITEVVDADLPGGVPKFVEITNRGGQVADLSEYSLGVYNNGSTSLANGSAIPLVGQLGPQESFVLCLEIGAVPGASTFFEVYGFDPDQFELNRQINGDDALVLFHFDQESDVFGVVGVDGSGESWEYTDGYARRLPAQLLPSSSFSVEQWELSGPDGLSGMPSPDLAGQTSPGQP